MLHAASHAVLAALRGDPEFQLLAVGRAGEITPALQQVLFQIGQGQVFLTGAAETTETKVMQDLRDTSKATVVGVFKELFKFKPVPALGRYDGPKLSVITSLNETPFSLHKLVSNLPHKMITGAGHWLQLDKPEEFNRTMDDFLTSIGNITHLPAAQ